MRQLPRLLAASLAFLLLAVSSNQVLTRGYIFSNIGTLFTWSGTAQAWSGSLQNATEGDFCTWVKNNGCAGESALRDITSSQATSWAVNSSVHSPILANASFQSTCGSWTFAGVSGTGLFAVAPTCATSGDADSDGFYSLFTTSGSSCASSATCEGTTAQTVNIAGTPTSQTISFFYKGQIVQATGDSTNCSPQTGTVGLTLKVNSTTITLPTLTKDNTWRSSGNLSITALVNGSNTITFTQSGTATQNQNFVTSHCAAFTYSNNTIGVDEVVLTATY